MTKILLVEDDEALAAGAVECLRRESFEVDHASDLAKARAILSSEYDVVLLDWMLPDGQGIDLLMEMKAKSIQVPVIMLTARTELTDKVLGLEMGADDYLTKPYEARELIARIRVQLRQGQAVAGAKTANQDQAVIQQGDVKLDLTERQAYFNGDPVTLTNMEFGLLKVLMEAPGKVFTRDELLNLVWGFDSYPTTRTVDTHVLQVRQKFRDDLIETVRGVGYRYKKGS